MKNIVLLCCFWIIFLVSSCRPVDLKSKANDGGSEEYRQRVEVSPLSRIAAERKIRELIAGQKADIGVAVINASDKTDTILVNSDKRYPMMSVFKFPVSIALCEWLDRNKRSLEDTIEVLGTELLESTWSPMRDKYGKRNLRLTYKEILSWALTQSDNNACDILIDRIGGVNAVNIILRDLKADDGISISVTEAQMNENPSTSLENNATPKAIAELFETYDKKLRKRSENFAIPGLMLEQCETGLDRLPAPFKDDEAIIGHKTGTGFGTENGGISALNDCGYIVLRSGQKYYIAVFVADSPSSPSITADLIGKISAIVKGYFSTSQHRQKK